LRSKEPVQAVVEVMKEVGSVADVVIVLSDADPTTNLAIASTVQGVDVIIAGGEATQEVSENPATGALILSPGYPGRSMGVARAVFDSQGHLQKYQWDRALYFPIQ
jgi:2',3'-cyclic-nucleotide 2'-phosphodiesterase (5'-nucleotidase family)